jgi:predicted methyltransferase
MGPQALNSSRRLFALLSVIALTDSYAAAKAPADSKERDAWQRPAEVMDALGIKPGSVVADVGAGSGYFTLHLAHRVGPEGKIYAEDIKANRLSEISESAKNEHLAQVKTILGSPDDPRLPPEALDAILVVDAFHEMVKYDAMLQGTYRALKPGGLLGIIDGETKTGQPRAYYHEHHRIPEELVREDVTRNGFQFLRGERGFERPSDGKKYYFLVYEKPKPSASGAACARRVLAFRIQILSLSSELSNRMRSRTQRDARRGS